MPKTEKIIRDPLYNYIIIDRKDDEWILELLDTPEVQRLRRIHQLGVSCYTYPGADHSRLSHTLGVLHLMQNAWKHLKTLGEVDPGIERAKHLLLAAAILHDVGHGPFSHLFEPCLGINHEDWSCKIIQSPDTEVHHILSKYDIPPEQVTDLIEKNNFRRPPWQKNLLSSELDIDRLDYLRRDSYFAGSGYGHFDWYRILHSFQIYMRNGSRILVWPDKSKYAIEEYIFARFYMYNNVYLHKTTRGFEKLLHAAWNRAIQIGLDGGSPEWIASIASFFQHKTIQHYLAIDDAAVLFQVQTWANHQDKVLNDLARRFLNRKGFTAIDPPEKCQPQLTSGKIDPKNAPWIPIQAEWEEELNKLLKDEGFTPHEFYALRDDLKLSIYAPYETEKEEQEQSPYNAIFISPDEGGEPLEISKVLPRLSAFTGKRPQRYRYYVPKEIAIEVKELRTKWCN
jgi:HD superfamily phosphohydrolase